MEATALTKPMLPIQKRREQLAGLSERLVGALDKLIEKKRNGLQICEGKLKAFNPAKVLDRGYSLTLDSSGRPITDCQSVRPGDTIQTRLANGTLESVVENIEGNSEQANGEEKENND